MKNTNTSEDSADDDDDLRKRALETEAMTNQMVAVPENSPLRKEEEKDNDDVKQDASTNEFNSSINETGKDASELQNVTFDYLYYEDINSPEDFDDFKDMSECSKREENAMDSEGNSEQKCSTGDNKMCDNTGEGYTTFQEIMVSENNEIEMSEDAPVAGKDLLLSDAALAYSDSTSFEDAAPVISSSQLCNKEHLSSNDHASQKDGVVEEMTDDLDCIFDSEENVSGYLEKSNIGCGNAIEDDDDHNANDNSKDNVCDVEDITSATEKNGNDINIDDLTIESNNVKDVVDATFPTDSHNMKDVDDATIATESHNIKELEDATFPTDSRSIKDVKDATLPTESHNIKDVEDDTFPTESHNIKDVEDDTFPTESHNIKDVEEASLAIDSHDINDVKDATFPTESHNVQDVEAASLATDSHDNNDMESNSNEGELLKAKEEITSQNCSAEKIDLSSVKEITTTNGSDFEDTVDKGNLLREIQNVSLESGDTISVVRKEECASEENVNKVSVTDKGEFLDQLDFSESTTEGITLPNEDDVTCGSEPTAEVISLSNVENIASDSLDSVLSSREGICNEVCVSKLKNEEEDGVYSEEYLAASPKCGIDPEVEDITCDNDVLDIKPEIISDNSCNSMDKTTKEEEADYLVEESKIVVPKVGDISFESVCITKDTAPSDKDRVHNVTRTKAAKKEIIGFNQVDYPSISHQRGIVCEVGDIVRDREPVISMKKEVYASEQCSNVLKCTEEMLCSQLDDPISYRTAIPETSDTSDARKTVFTVRNEVYVSQKGVSKLKCTEKEMSYPLHMEYPSTALKRSIFPGTDNVSSENRNSVFICSDERCVSKLKCTRKEIVYPDQVDYSLNAHDVNVSHLRDVICHSDDPACVTKGGIYTDVHSLVKPNFQAEKQITYSNHLDYSVREHERGIVPEVHNVPHDDSESMNVLLMKPEILPRNHGIQNSKMCSGVELSYPFHLRDIESIDRRIFQPRSTVINTGNPSASLHVRDCDVKCSDLNCQVSGTETVSVKYNDDYSNVGVSSILPKRVYNDIPFQSSRRSSQSDLYIYDSSGQDMVLYRNNMEGSTLPFGSHVNGSQTYSYHQVPVQCNSNLKRMNDSDMSTNDALCPVRQESSYEYVIKGTCRNKLPHEEVVVRKVKKHVFQPKIENSLDSKYKPEIDLSLPLKKRLRTLAAMTNADCTPQNIAPKEESFPSYPAKPMISIAELEFTEGLIPKPGQIYRENYK